MMWMCFFVAIGFNVFVHLHNVHVRVSRMWEIYTGHIDFVMITLDSCGNHPFADVFCLNDLSFAFVVLDYTNSLF